jgi:NADPH2:quinone reductase
MTVPANLRALRFSAFTGPNALSLETLPLSARGASEVLVQVRGASLNPSDVKNLQGRMHGTTLPRTPGRDFAGIVVDGRADLIGLGVWGAGGEIGYTRDGSHAEYLLVPENGVARKPVNCSFAEAAAAGVAFITAWSGVHDVLRLEAGQTIAVSGALGAVGSAVVQLARWIGARTIGVVRDSPADETAGRADLPDALVESGHPDLVHALHAVAPNGVDAVFDTVGEPVFASLIESLNVDGRYAVIANVGKPEAALNILSFYRRRLTLGGVDSRGIDAVAGARILERLRPGFETGALHPPRVDQIVSLEEATDAYRKLAEGSSLKFVINPHASL